MLNLERDCNFINLSEKQPIVDFDCGDEDLNDFFNREAIEYRRQMLAHTCFFTHRATKAVVSAFSYCASSIKMSDLSGSHRKKVKEYVPREKTLRAYPAILIGRLGVASGFNGQGLGSQLMVFVKSYCLAQFSHFARFLLLDAYNKPEVLRFYQKNDFLPVFATEMQEREAYKQDVSEALHTRYMFYDMIHWKNRISQ
jgi:GNAT superfamily N-acetyltransferase